MPSIRLMKVDEALDKIREVYKKDWWKTHFNGYDMVYLKEQRADYVKHVLEELDELDGKHDIH